ncbi:MAG: HAMP domain-containing sensor histidine kinase [Rhodomicrobium sp.]
MPPLRPTSLRSGYWPVTLKVPALVALFMIGISVVLSDRVMTRLAESQERHLAELSGAYLDGLSSSLQPAILQEDVWEVFDGLDRAKELYAGLDGVLTVVMNPDRRVIAASAPSTFPAGADVPAALLRRFQQGKAIQADYKAAKGYAYRELTVQDRPIGAIYTELDISRIMAERADARRALLVTNGLLTLGLAALGYLVVRRVIAPLNTLSQHLGHGIEGELKPVPDRLLGSSNSEFGYLLRRYNALAAALNERRQYAERLAENEKLASLGRVASGLAHEINNPLGGMLNTVSVLKRHGREPGVLAESIEILERGLQSIRDVVRATLLTYRSNLSNILRRDDFEDLKLLIKPEIEKKALTLEWHNDLGADAALPATGLRHVTLNLLLNACAATERNGTVGFDAAIEGGKLAISVSDTGAGLPANFKEYLEAGDAAVPLERGRGLGLWIVKRSVMDMGGAIAVEHPASGGTIIRLGIPVGVRELKDVA